MMKKHMKKCSASLAIKKMQIKTTLRFHLIPVRMAIIKNITTDVGDNVGKREPSYLLFLSSGVPTNRLT
jgi:hypothetical protein